MQRLSGAAAALVVALAAAGGAAAHDEHGGGSKGRPEAAVIANEPDALEFVPPAPGSYALPPLGTAADGAVVTSDGRDVRLHDLFDGRVVLLSFVYATCGDARGCPLATATLHRVQRRLRSEPGLAQRLRLLTLSFDPERDTPEVMADYGAGFQDERLEWLFLTTRSDARLAPILDAYGQHVVEDVDAQGRGLGRFSHVLRVFLIDPRRHIRNIYSVSFLQPEVLVNDVRTLLLEEAGGLGAGQVAGAAKTTRGPGDDRAGYDDPAWRTRSRALDGRAGAGAAVDLAARVERPPLGLPPVPVPHDNPVTREKVALGRLLFFDRRLSGNGTFSCAMCHVPEQGFAHAETETAVGIEGRTVRRNAPTLYNVAYVEHLFLDGRETRLEHQIWGPLLAANEMGNVSIGMVVEGLRQRPEVVALFERAFPGRGLALETIGMAIASYERTLVSANSPFDRWNYGGDRSALSPAAQRGFSVFVGRGGCADCHRVGSESATFSDGGFHDTGVGFAASMQRRRPTQRIQVAPGRWLDVDPGVFASVSEPRPSDLGRYEVTRDPADRWRYRTPTLRNVALTAPYMHDGSLATLRDVVLFYDRGGVPNEGLDPRIHPLGLSERDVDDVVAFLESLTGSDVDALVADAFAAPIGDRGSTPVR